MKEKHLHLLIVSAVVLAVGGGIYWVWKNNQTAATASTPAAPAKTA